MIKYSIFIQGGESMKKIISLVLATLVCAAVFVGCGSGENKTTSSTSISQRDTISKYVPHSEKVTWDSNVYDVMNNDNIIIEQLEFEQYSHEDAVYAADNCGADWNEQAAKKAQDYLDIMAFSRQGLIDQLQFEGYTYEQAVYGVNQVGL